MRLRATAAGLVGLALGCAPRGQGAGGQGSVVPSDGATEPPVVADAERVEPLAEVVAEVEDGPDDAGSGPSGAVAQPEEPSLEPAEPEPSEPSEPLAFVPGGPPLEIARRVRTGVQPKSVTVSPDGTRLYVCNFGLANRRNVYVYDAQSLQTVGRIDFPGNATEVAVSADGATLYVSNFSRGLIEVVDAVTLEVQAEVDADINPKWMVIDEPRDTLYVSNWSSRTVTAIDTTKRQAVRRLKTGRRPRGMALLDDGTLLVGAMWDHRVQVYAPGSTVPDREFLACENPRHLVLSPDQQRLYVSCSGDRILRWFDPRTGQVQGEAPTGLNPRTIDITRDGRYVAVADFSGSTVTVVDVVQGTHRTHAVPRSKQIVGLAVAPGDELTVYATSWLGNELFELQLGASG